MIFFLHFYLKSFNIAWESELNKKNGKKIKTIFKRFHIVSPINWFFSEAKILLYMMLLLFYLYSDIFFLPKPRSLKIFRKWTKLHKKDFGRETCQKFDFIKIALFIYGWNANIMLINFHQQNITWICPVFGKLRQIWYQTLIIISHTVSQVILHFIFRYLFQVSYQKSEHKGKSYIWSCLVASC